MQGYLAASSASAYSLVSMVQRRLAVYQSRSRDREILSRVFCATEALDLSCQKVVLLSLCPMLQQTLGCTVPVSLNIRSIVCLSLYASSDEHMKVRTIPGYGGGMSSAKVRSTHPHLEFKHAPAFCVDSHLLRPKAQLESDTRTLAYEASWQSHYYLEDV